MLVANSYTGKLFPVDAFAVVFTIRYRELASRRRIPPEDLYWSPRLQTIYDLLMAGF